MASPTVTARIAPTGFKLPDGYRSLVAFAGDPDIQLWERAVKPPGFDGGDAIDISTMFNNAWHTMNPRVLKKMDEGTFMAAYDPDAINDILAQLNVNQSITYHYPDGSSLAFWGFLKKFEFGELKEGEFPEATVTIAVTNYDPSAFVEAGPVFVAGGT